MLPILRSAGLYAVCAAPLCAWPHLLAEKSKPLNCESGTILYLEAGDRGNHYFRCTNSSWKPVDPQALGIFDVRATGAHGDGIADDQVAIAKALRSAAVHGGIVFFPPGTYAHSGVLDGGSGTLVMGEGPRSVLLATRYPDAALRFRGSVNSELANIKTVSRASTRLMNPESATVLLEDARDCKVTGVEIQGGGSAGMMIRSSSGITITNNRISDTKADGIHVVDGSRNVTVSNNVAYNTGDDSFSAVAYRATPQTADVRIEGNISIGSRARGVSCIGAARCVIRNNQVEFPGAHGIAVAFEQVYNTYKPVSARLEQNIVKGVINPVMNSLLIDDAEGVDVEGLQVSGSTPVYCTHSSNVRLSHLQVSGAITVGIAAVECANFSVLDSKVTGAGEGGIRMQGIRKGEISRNQLSGLFEKKPDGSAAIDLVASSDVGGAGNVVGAGSSSAPLRIAESNASSIGLQRPPH